MVGADHGADEGHYWVQRSQRHLQQLLPAPPARQGRLPGQPDREHKLQDNMNYDTMRRIVCIGSNHLWGYNNTFPGGGTAQGWRHRDRGRCDHWSVEICTFANVDSFHVVFQEPWMWGLCCSIKHSSTISKYETILNLTSYNYHYKYYACDVKWTVR